MYNIEKIWKDWRTVDLIGEGSYGKVFLIERNRYGITERSALKIISIPSSDAEVNTLRNEGMDDESVTSFYKSLAQDFINEIAVMSKLNGNGNIVTFQDYEIVERGEGIGCDILIRMELLTPLSKILSETRMTEKNVIQLGDDLCGALSSCHAMGIIHRDIKIDNIFVSDTGTFKLGDFGVARILDKTTGEMSKKGTYTYMAPEVYKGGSYDKTADLYSLGMVMYRLMNYNREPFVPLPPQAIKYTDKNNALVRRMRGDALPSPACAGDELSNIILKACAYRASDRFESADEMLLSLKAICLPEENNTAGIAALASAYKRSIESGSAAIQSGYSAQKTDYTVSAFSKTDADDVREGYFADLSLDDATVSAFDIRTPSSVNDKDISDPPKSAEKKEERSEFAGKTGLSGGSETEKAKKTPKKKGKKKIIIIASVIGVVVCAAAFILSKKEDTGSLSSSVAAEKSAPDSDTSYDWRVTDVVVNNSEYDESTNMRYISINDVMYVHFTLEGGTPGEKISPVIHKKYPDNTGDKSDFTDSFYSGDRVWFSVRNNDPQKAEIGTLTYMICDNKGTLLYEGSAEFTRSRSH